MTAVYPGSFDPLTYGHMDIIERAARIFDDVCILVMENVNKKHFFNLEERVEIVEDYIARLPNVSIMTYDGLLVNFARENRINIVIRGLRAVSDFELELQMAHANNAMNSELETLFLMTDTRHSFVSSSMVREIALFNGDITRWVSPFVVEFFKRKLHEMP